MIFLLDVLVVASALIVVPATQPLCGGPDEAKAIAGIFSGCMQRDRSNCPAEKWLELFKDSDMQNGSKSGYNIMNVGFNKGFNFATWLNVFVPGAKVDAHSWYEALDLATGLAGECGACFDCQTPPVLSPHMSKPNPHIHMVGVDLNKAMISAVGGIIVHLNKTHDLSQVKLELVHAAGGFPSTEPGAVNSLKVPVCPGGQETCRIPDDPAKMSPNQQYEDVPLVSVDGLVHDLHFLKATHERERGHVGSSFTGSAHHKHHATDVIDILHIDTEGNDAEVIKSAEQLLKARKIRALVFEYHYFLPWGRTKLQDVSESLNQQGMECFMCGQDRLWPITGMCWDPKYEFHEWSNVMCVLRTDPWFRAVEPLVQTASRLLAHSPLEGWLVNLHGMNDIFLIKDGKRHGFKDWDAFTSRGYNNRQVKRFDKSCDVISLFPEGDLLS